MIEKRREGVHARDKRLGGKLVGRAKERPGQDEPPPPCEDIGYTGHGSTVVGLEVHQPVPVIGSRGEPGVCPVYKSRRRPELAPDQLSENAKHSIKARMTRPMGPDANQLREEAVDQVEEGWLGGSRPFDVEGRLLTKGGPRKVNPAFRFWGSIGRKVAGGGRPGE